jgi:AAA domain
MSVTVVTPCPDCGGPNEDYLGPERVCWPCWATQHGGDRDTPKPKPEAVTVSAIGDFASVDEPGVDAVVGDPDNVLIPAGGDIMVYGDGGAGKTTLTVDAAFHMASGEDWIGLPIQRPVRVLLIECEGPRALFRKKLRHKLNFWKSGPVNAQLHVLEAPWATFSFASETWRVDLARTVAGLQVDVVIAGPLARIGMDGAGTLQEVVAFMALINDVRRRSGQLLTTVLIHHENKGGAVSGAWEGSGDTLLHVQAAGNGHTVVHVQKARWSSEHHGKTLKLAWADGESFELEGDRDYITEIRELLSERPWRTVKEIAKPADEGGIGAGDKTIKSILEKHPDLFEMRTGDAAKALGRTGNAKVYGTSMDCVEPQNAVDAVDRKRRSEEGAKVVLRPASPLRDAVLPERTHLLTGGTASTPERSPVDRPPCNCADGGAEPADDGRCSRCFGVLP